jgi:hypothetical protein
MTCKDPPHDCTPSIYLCNLLLLTIIRNLWIFCIQNIKLLQYNIINLTNIINMHFFLIVDHSGQREEWHGTCTLKASFVDFVNSSTKDYFFRLCQTLYTFLNGIQKWFTLLTYPFHHFFIVFIYYWGGLGSPSTIFQLYRGGKF